MLALSNPAASALRKTILAMSAEKSVDSIGVAELCRRAGVTRETFYQYATSPSGFLAVVMDDELSTFAVLAGGLSDTRRPGATVMDAPTRELLEHVRRNEQVYRLALTPRLTAAIRNVLIDRVQALLVAHAHRYPGILPSMQGNRPTSREVDMMAAFAASGVVGAIEVSVDAGLLDDLDRAVDLVHAVSAPWWLGRSV
jgi:AcrR family transcriptional regulator